jgi:ribosome-binding factor A
VAQRVNLKFAPEIRFRVDEGFANAAKIDALLHSAKVIQDWAPESSEQASGEETSDEPEAPAKEAEEPK